MKDSIKKQQNSVRYSPFTFWREARMVENGQTERTLSYVLDRISCLNKKQQNADRNISGELCVKGTDKDPQIVGKFNSAVYEYLRTCFTQYLKECDHGKSICENKEGSGLTVQTTITLFDKDDDRCVFFTINFYHTTNTILVNHTSGKKKHIDLFMTLYDNIMKELPIQRTIDLNSCIRTACQDAIQELNRDSSQDVDHYRSQKSPCSNTLCQHNSISEPLSRAACTDAIRGLSGDESLDVDVDHLRGKFFAQQQSQIGDAVIKVCQDAIKKLEGQSLNNSDHPIASTSCLKRNKRAAFKESSDVELEAVNKKHCYEDNACEYLSMDVGDGSEVQKTNDSIRPNNQKSTDSPGKLTTIEAIQIQLLDALGRINTLERKVQDLSYENVTLKKELGSIKLHNTSAVPPTSHTESYAGTVQRNNNVSRKATAIPQTARHTPKRNHHISFIPKKNIVVIVGKEGDIVANDDDIRRVIGGIDSDITIEKISRSSNNCFKRFCVQLSDERMVDSALTKWSSNLFGKSTARKVMQQSGTSHNSIGVVKGVPLYISDDQLCTDLEDGGFGQTTVKRINKGDKPTRAVKVYFNNHELLTKAINDRVRAQGLTFTVDTFNHSTVVRCYNCHQFKHTASSCPNVKRCHNCSESYHGDNCQEIAKCVNCKGNHRSSSVQCPIYIKLYNTIRNRTHRVTSTTSITSS